MTLGHQQFQLWFLRDPIAPAGSGGHGLNLAIQAEQVSGASPMARHIQNTDWDTGTIDSAGSC